MTSVSQAVAEVLLGDPVLRQCIARRVANYRRLARVLQPAVSRILGREVPVDTIKVALLRYSRTVGEERGRLTVDAVRAILEKAKLIRARPILAAYGFRWSDIPEDVRRFCEENGVKLRAVGELETG